MGTIPRPIVPVTEFSLSLTLLIMGVSPTTLVIDYVETIVCS